MECPKCQKRLDATGRAPGSSLACGSCGNVTVAPAARGKSGRGLFAGLALGAAVLVLPCVGILAAIAIPNFIRFGARARQAECKTNLKVWYAAQQASRPEEGFSPLVGKVGFLPERGNRYAYFAGRGPLEDRGRMDLLSRNDAVGFGVDTYKRQDARPITLEQLPRRLADSLGLIGSQCPRGPRCAVTLACAGDIDGDEGLDVWSISSVTQTGPDGEQYSPGEPIHQVDDLKN
jgi:type II secretory pathway pseudopilin PulG